MLVRGTDEKKVRISITLFISVLDITYKLKGYACFASFIDVLTPGKEILLTLSSENIEYFH